MDDFAGQPWFGWSLAIIVGLPILILVLSELHLRLQRRGNALAGPVNRLRLWLLPLAALLLLLTQASELKDDNAGVRVVATLVGIIAVTVALGGLNAVLFGNATEGTWRERLPSIFVDLARLILVFTGAGVVASYVWNLNVGGLFAALGVGSIVIGLALQTAIGSVVSGLLLLFEQPFKIGDTLDVGGTKGKVVEMNWRSTHVDIGSGIQIIPNATIAGASFANLSRPTPAHDLVLESAFAVSDSPQQVVSTLLSTARGLPHLRPDVEPSVRVLGSGKYATTLPLRSAGDGGTASTMFLAWLWYASRRDEVSLDGATFAQHPREKVVAALESVSTTLELDAEEIDRLADLCEIETYGQGEHLYHVGETPPRFGFILDGRVRISALAQDGGLVVVRDQDRGEIVGVSGYLREPSPAGSLAVTEVDVLQVDMDLIDRIVAARPSVARRLHQLMDSRTREIADAFAAVNASDAVVAAVRPATLAP